MFCDYYTVYYSKEDSVVPMSKEEVWDEIEGAPGLMDKTGSFYPEDFGFRIIQMFLF